MNANDPAPSGSNGFLKDCLVDGDAAEVARARRLRQRALIISAVIQAALVAGAVLYPLVATGERPEIPRTAIPIPRWGGKPRATQQQAHTTDAAQKAPKHKALPLDIYQPPIIPQHIYAGPDSGPPPTNSHVGEPLGSGPQIPGTENLPPGDRTWSSPQPVQPKPIAPPQQKPVLVSRGVMAAQLIERVEPVYPEAARRIHLEGTVELRAFISRDGRIQELEVLSGHPWFIRAAREAVLEWRYRPTLLNGEPVEVETIITVIFRIAR